MSGDINFFHYTNGLVDRDSFETGNPDLQRYVSKLMVQHESRNLARNYVAIKNGKCVSMFCLLSSMLNSDDSEGMEEKFPHGVDLPTVKIGRLVVDKNFRGQGIGEITLKKAINIFVEISKKIGVIGLTVDAKEDSVNWYPKYGFKSLNHDPERKHFPFILYTTTLKKMRPSLFETPV